MGILKFFNLRSTKPILIEAPKRGFAVSAGVSVTEDTAMQVSAFYRGVIYVSTQVAKLPWNIKDKQNNVLEDRVATLLDLSPNPEMDSFTFRCLAIQASYIHGNFIAEIERDALGRPTALWPIPHGYWYLSRTPTGELVYRVTPDGAGGKEVFLQAKDVWHIKNFHTKDGLLGQGVVAYGKDVLGITLGADRMAGNLFANGGIPSGVVEVPGVMSDEAFLRIKEAWNQNHSGRKSAGIAFLEEGMKFNPLNLQPDVLQFLESRKFSVLEIARFLGVPPTKLFDIDANSYNTQEQSNLEVATDTLDTWCRSLDMQTDIKILNKQFGGRRSEIDIYSLFRGDMETRANYFSKLMQTGAISPNEIRLKEGLSPYSGGSRFWIAVNNYSPADRVDEIIDSQIKKNSTPPSSPAPKEPTSQPKNKVDEELALEALNFLKRK